MKHCRFHSFTGIQPFNYLAILYPCISFYFFFCILDFFKAMIDAVDLGFEFVTLEKE
jgi:hypothetical protein